MDPTTATPTTSTPAPEATSPTTSPAATEARWFDSLPDDLKADPTLAKYTTLEGAARGLTGAVKLIGERPENLIKRPTAGDDAATRAVLHQLGLPETPEGYRLKAIEGGPATDTDLAKTFEAACFEGGVLPGAMQTVFEKVGGALSQFEAQQKEAAAAREDENMKALQTELGAALDDTLTRAEIVSNKFGVTQALNEAGLGTNPGLIKALAAVFPSLQEDTSGGRTGTTVGAKSPAEYIAEANDLQRQALTMVNQSERMALANKALRLRQLANAGR